MALNTIILPYNKILEVEECKPVSSPSSTSFEEHKSVPFLNQLNSSFFQAYKLPFELSAKRNNSSPPSLDSRKFQDFFFGVNDNKENTSLYSQKSLTNLNNINIEQEKEKQEKEEEKTINKDNNNKTNSSIERRSFQENISNNHSFPSNKIQTTTFDGNESQSSEKPFSYLKLRKKHNESEIISKKQMYRIYDNYINNPKINPVKEDNQIESFNDDISEKDFECKVNNEKKNEKVKSLSKKEIPKINTRINEINKISISPSLNYRNSNPNPLIKNGIYVKKRIPDSNRTFGKKMIIDEISNFSINRDSIKIENKIKSLKKPLILNVNLKNKKIETLKISQFQKIMKNDGLFYILRFLTYSDIINLFKAKNKQLCILINTALLNMYYFNIKESLKRYNNFIELLKCSIVQSKIKDALKIDFVINIRFINNQKNPNNKKYKIKLGDSNNKFVEPLYIQFGYIYNYFQKVKGKKELITKEEYEKKIKRQRIYDYYTFDLYPENKNNKNVINKNPVFISKELSLFEKDGNNNIVNIQPLLPFCINDKGIINLELYTTNNGFIDPDSIKIIIKAYNLKKYIKMLSEKEISNQRISELEDLCVHWKNINLYKYHKELTAMMKNLFEPLFEINDIYFGNIGVFIFKVNLKAKKIGEINDKNKLEIKIKIKDVGDYIENEIRKNNLLFERRDIYELRVGDEFLYYFSLK